MPATGVAPVRLTAPLSQAQRIGRTRPAHSHRRVLSGHNLLAGDEKAQSRIAAMGKDLQHRAPSPVARLLNPAAVPAAGFISTKGMKSVTDLLDEYTLLSYCFSCENMREEL